MKARMGRIRRKGAPETTLERPLQELAEYSDDVFAGGPVPAWNENQLPDPVAMYSFACRQMALLASACPDFEIRKAAAEFLAHEFAPRRNEGISERQAADHRNQTRTGPLHRCPW